MILFSEIGYSKIGLVESRAKGNAADKGRKGGEMVIEVIAEGELGDGGEEEGSYPITLLI